MSHRSPAKRICRILDASLTRRQDNYRKSNANDGGEEKGFQWPTQTYVSGWFVSRASLGMLTLEKARSARLSVLLVTTVTLLCRNYYSNLYHMLLWYVYVYIYIYIHTYITTIIYMYYYYHYYYIYIYIMITITIMILLLLILVLLRITLLLLYYYYIDIYYIIAVLII